MARVVAPSEGYSSPEIAEALLGLAFEENDRRRMAELVEAAQARELSDAEKSEAESYRRVENWLVGMKSKARQTLSKLS